MKDIRAELESFRENKVRMFAWIDSYFAKQVAALTEAQAAEELRALHSREFARKDLYARACGRTWGLFPADETEILAMMRRCWAGVNDVRGFFSLFSEPRFLALNLLYESLFRCHALMGPVPPNAPKKEEGAKKSLAFRKAWLCKETYTANLFLVQDFAIDALPEERAKYLAMSISTSTSLKKNVRLATALQQEHGFSTHEKLIEEALPLVCAAEPKSYKEFLALPNAVRNQIEHELGFLQTKVSGSDNDKKRVGFPFDPEIHSPAPAPQIESPLEYAELLAKLTPAERETFELIVQGYTAKEIAAKRGESVYAVERRIERTRKRLQSPA